MKSLFLMLWRSGSSALDVIVVDESSEARSVRFKLKTNYFRLVVVATAALLLTCVASLLVMLSATKLQPGIAPESGDLALTRISALEDSLRVQHQYLERLRTILLGLPEGEAPPASVVSVIRYPPPSESGFPVQPPVRGILTRMFNSEAHFGVDVAGTLQSSVTTVLPGVVQLAEWTHSGGYTVLVRHPGGYSSVYKHLSTLLVRKGQVLRTRDPVGLLGSTGMTSTAPHLHFELWHELVPVNPAYYIAGWSPSLR